MGLPYQANHSRIIYYWSIYYKMVPNIVVDSSAHLDWLSMKWNKMNSKG